MYKNEDMVAEEPWMCVAVYLNS